MPGKKIALIGEETFTNLAKIKSSPPCTGLNPESRSVAILCHATSHNRFCTL